MDTLGERLCFIRKKLGLTQAQFAKQLGFDRALTISRYENNQREPNVSVLVEVAKQGRVSLDWLLTGKIGSAGEETYSYAMRNILLMLEDMEEDKRRDVLKHLKEKKLLEELLEERRQRKEAA